MQVVYNFDVAKITFIEINDSSCLDIQSLFYNLEAPERMSLYYLEQIEQFYHFSPIFYKIHYPLYG